jgi:hypothetical protein
LLLGVGWYYSGWAVRRSAVPFSTTTWPVSATWASAKCGVAAGVSESPRICPQVVQSASITRRALAFTLVAGRNESALTLKIGSVQ